MESHRLTPLTLWARPGALELASPPHLDKAGICGTRQHTRLRAAEVDHP